MQMKAKIDLPVKNYAGWRVIALDTKHGDISFGQ